MQMYSQLFWGFFLWQSRYVWLLASMRLRTTLPVTTNPTSFIYDQNASLVYISLSTLDRPLSLRHSLTLNELQLRKLETPEENTTSRHALLRDAQRSDGTLVSSDHEGLKEDRTVTITYRYKRCFPSSLLCSRWTETLGYFSSSQQRIWIFSATTKDLILYHKM